METERRKHSSGSPWEKKFGYSRAIRAGNSIHVSGTTSTKNGKILHKGNAYAQAQEIFGIIKESIEALGGHMEDIVRTRMYVADMNDSESVGRAHGEFFGDIRPAATMVEVSGLIDPGLLVEIEAEAFVDH